MKLVKASCCCVLGFVSGVAIMCACGSTLEKAKARQEIRYFDRFHSDNEYLYSFKEEFEFPMAPDRAKKSGDYYKVYYGPEGKYYKAERFRNRKLKELYFFDCQERVIQSREKDNGNMWWYGEGEKIRVLVEGPRIAEYWIYTYEGDKLMKLGKYIPAQVTLEYTEYDHDKQRYRTYDINGKPLDEGPMRLRGK